MPGMEQIENSICEDDGAATGIAPFPGRRTILDFVSRLANCQGVTPLAG